jgi:hypothetical protein
VYKRVVINETQFVPGWVTGTELGTGLAQVTPDTLRLLSNFGYIQIPSNVNKNENASLLALLQNPTFNANAGMANLVYIYNGITQKNKIHDWQMSDDDIWKFVAALYNAGPQGPWIYGTPDPLGHDFWEANRLVIQNDPNWYEAYGCNDPSAWECLKLMFPNKDVEGQCTILYAESVAPDGISTDPTSSDILNTLPYDRQECTADE